MIGNALSSQTILHDKPNSIKELNNNCNIQPSVYKFVVEIASGYLESLKLACHQTIQGQSKKVALF